MSNNIIPETDLDAIEAAFLQELLLDPGSGRDAITDSWIKRLPDQESLLKGILQDISSGTDVFEDPGRPLGPYRNLRWIASGGQGDVYLAEDSRLQRTVAIKALRSLRSRSGDGIRRLRREAAACARLDHPGLCPIYDIIEDTGTPFLVMKHIEGRSLAAEIEKRRGAPRIACESPSEASAWIHQVLVWVEQLADALHVAHSAGIVHRDIKPSNVLIERTGQAVLIDFGTALIQDEEDAAHTATGHIVGTPAYLTPDQLRLPTAEVDMRSDIYGLGLILFEAITLKNFQLRPTREQLLHAVEHEDPPDPRRENPSVSRDLACVILTALRKDRDHRYATANDLRKDLQCLLTGQPVAARPLKIGTRAARWLQRNRLIASGVGLVFIALALGLVTTLHYANRSRETLLAWQQLADRMVAQNLLKEASEDLWPIHPARVSAMETWIRRAEELFNRKAVHDAQWSILKNISIPPSTSSTAVRTDNRPTAPTEDQFRFDQLTRLREEIDQVHLVLKPDDQNFASVPYRLALAREILQATVRQYEKEWSDASARIQRHPGYDGLRLSPQVGLVPIGPDPSSSLEEFAVLYSGDLPTRDQHGALVLTETSAIVLVLMPGGDATVGTQKTDPGGLHFDPLARLAEGPPQVVRLAPFFMGKYEVTQAQWVRLGGENKSCYQPGVAPRGVPITLRNPVEQLTHKSCVDLLRRLSLVLPTEAQWEYSCRAGSSSAYFIGDDPHSLAGYANIADAASVPFYVAGWNHLPDFDDGHGAHAPVGSYKANAFGLHDMHGNVMEWCRDSYAENLSIEARPGDGLREPSSTSLRAFRGGSYQLMPAFARSSFRSGMAESDQGSDVGLRASRAVEP